MEFGFGPALGSKAEVSSQEGLGVVGMDSESDLEGFEISDGELSSNLSLFDIDFDEFGKTKARVVERKNRMSLVELLDESSVVPIIVYDKRGAAAVVASKEVDIEETLQCKALVIVKDTNAVIAGLAALFYRYPSYSIQSSKTLESTNTTPDAVLVQKLMVMVKVVHNGTEALVMKSSRGLALGRDDEVNFDIAVFTNLTRDHLDFHGTEEEYKDAKAKLFLKMVDPERHHKVVNITTSMQLSFVQENPDVAVVIFAVENKKANIHPLKLESSLFEIHGLVSIPQGILEVPLGLLGKHNIYKILAAVAVGIAVGAPLEDIVRGTKEVDAVPSRCELIDEEQTFGVIMDSTPTPEALSRILDHVRELGPMRVITVFG
ncbi:unnamed protein product [Fraxinus pennsylvanica]|uniref:Mur ligase central domain-containing protein n=1 Tax=Fraxinus pennsylvanica TaxID=56036 RepID=A0AAD1ZU76_9LAMI|nr:unnamed protein product [Fraxinus pennsylvanica]